MKNDAPRKVRVNIAGNPYIDGEEQEYVQGRMIDMLVQGDEVYLVSSLLPKPPTAAHPTAADRVIVCDWVFSMRDIVIISGVCTDCEMTARGGLQTHTERGRA